MKHDKSVNKLISALQQLIRVLKTHQLTRWEEWFKRDLASLQHGHYRSAVSHILQAYGGMGSFTDVVIDGPDGDKLAELADAVYQLASDVR